MTPAKTPPHQWVTLCVDGKALVIRFPTPFSTPLADYTRAVAPGVSKATGRPSHFHLSSYAGLPPPVLRCPPATARPTLRNRSRQGQTACACPLPGCPCWPLASSHACRGYVPPHAIHRPASAWCSVAAAR